MTDNDDPGEYSIRLLKNPDGQWTARDVHAGITAQGETRNAALDNLNDVVKAVDGDVGHPPTDQEIHELGVEPEVARSQDDDVPDILQ